MKVLAYSLGLLRSSNLLSTLPDLASLTITLPAMLKSRSSHDGFGDSAYGAIAIKSVHFNEVEIQSLPSRANPPTSGSFETGFTINHQHSLLIMEYFTSHTSCSTSINMSCNESRPILRLKLISNDKGNQSASISLDIVFPATL
jgi:hypothetical protein